MTDRAIADDFADYDFHKLFIYSKLLSAISCTVEHQLIRFQEIQSVAWSLCPGFANAEPPLVIENGFKTDFGATTKFNIIKPFISINVKPRNHSTTSATQGSTIQKGEAGEIAATLRCTAIESTALA